MIWSIVTQMFESDTSQTHNLLNPAQQIFSLKRMHFLHKHLFFFPPQMNVFLTTVKQLSRL